MKNLTFKNDPLLLDNETLKDIIPTKKYPFLLLIQRSSETLNLFSAFVKKQDFIRKDKINQPFQKTVYVKVPKKLGDIIRRKFTDKKKLQCLLESYICRRSDLQKAINRWFKTNVFPFIILRLMSENNYSDFSKLIQEIEYFTDFLNKSRFNCPKTMKELLIPQIVYLAGCSAGDGHIDKMGKRWTLVEGTPRKEFLHFSEKFVLNLISLIKRFSIEKYRFTQNENKYVLTINNKLFCRFLNYFFDLPFGKKESLYKPSILRLSDEDIDKYFWRGWFDTDGSVNPGGCASLSSNSSTILDECKKYLLSNGISPKKSIKGTELTVHIKYLREFSKIGFAHPRKQQELINILRRESKYTLAKVKKNHNKRLNQELLEILKLLRVDNNYRIRIHKRDLMEKGIDLDKVIKILESKFNKKFNKGSSLIYFKSKKAYEFLNNLFIYESLNKPLTLKEETILLKELNSVWE